MVYKLFAYTAGFLLLVFWWAFLCLWLIRHADCNFLFLYCSCFVLVLGLKWPHDMSREVFPFPLFYQSLWKIIISLFIQGYLNFQASLMALEKEMATPVFLPGEFHGWRNLTGYSPCSRKESDTTEWLTHTHTHTQTHIAHLVKNLCAIQETLVQFLGWEDPLEKG